MRTKTYALLSGLLFSMLALLHLTRIVTQWDAVIIGWEVPLWVSWVALFIATGLAYHGLKIFNKTK